MASLSTDPAHPSTQNLRAKAATRAARLHRFRQEIRTGGSAALDACELLEGRDFALAAKLVDGAERLLARLGVLERRVSP